MDKELLRIVIIATGLIIITGMLAWAFFKSKKYRQSLDDFDDKIPVNTERHLREPIDDDDFPDIFDEEVAVTLASAAPQGGEASKSGRYQAPASDDRVEHDDEEDYVPEPRFAAPSIIQFTLVANQEEGFNGLDLAHAFNIVGLEYGNLNIYERLDANRLVDFGVASMVKPGTFPEHDLEAYYCPGVVFFMQPGELDDPVAVFDDFVQTVVFVATELDGTVLDHEHKPLSETTVELIRRSL